MDVVSFGISATVAHALTNLDNLAIMSGLMLASGRLRVLCAYLIAQMIVLGVALSLGENLGNQVPQYTGYLGVIPILVGVGAIWNRIRLREETENAAAEKMGSFAILALFLSVSVDTFAVFAPAMADSEDAFRLAALVGGALSAGVLGVTALAMGRVSGGVLNRLVRLDTLAPYVMIAVGLYVLINTGTDVAG
ncbi:hypothetical protein [Shimia haliotis]|uniref:Cadmium resistance protein CadD, predicted permease n=1 Tax=Shimia haliotis TaxID=1280847 RepID=A0A1I4B8R4_9RHOB|nr:hypothetical protein [Shimia haliotis]SFK64903.1 Cadmium resistance protein CadD, predicted permease [Shimia haliotis]